MDYRKSADVLQKELLSEIDNSYEKTKGIFMGYSKGSCDWH